jgi:hypothetical protein
MSLRQRIELKPMPIPWLNEMAIAHHYMRQAVHPRANPFGWAVLLDGQMCQPDGKPSGFIIFASVHFTQLKGEFGFPGLPTKWQVLLLSRLWLHDSLPKFSETCVIGKALKLVQRRWLEVHPPRFLDEPYHILKVISYANTRLFEGTIYKAANFRDNGLTQSQKRHKNTRGAVDGDELRRYIYDLKRPNWKYRTLGEQMSLFSEGA